MAVPRDVYRAVSASFPTGVVIVTTLDEAGQPKGLLNQTFVGLSTDPPLMLVSIDKTSRTLPHLQHHGAFVINFLREGSEDLATLFASKIDEKFSGVRWAPSPQARAAAILRDASIAYAACVVTRTIEAGDHWIFIGSVEAGEVFGGAPLMYYRRSFAAWPEKRPAPPVEGA